VEEESSTVTREYVEVSIDEEGNCSETFPILVSDGIENSDVLMIPSEEVVGLDIEDLGEDDGASVKSDSSTSSAGSVWVMEDMVKSTASVREPVPDEDKTSHHPGNISNFRNIIFILMFHWCVVFY